jgi:hypothetical protein
MKFYEFDANIKINHIQLKKELGCSEVYIREDKLVIGGDLTKEEATAGLAAHIPEPYPEPTVQEKLASVGLSVDDLKTALGL